ncbi:MAG: prolyl oligopeptidase family serine peptidase [Acidimicrobiales bacterium]
MSSTRPYGTWPSPLSAEHLAAGGVRVDGVACRGDSVWWAELRPAEGGRAVLVRRRGDGEPVDVLPAPFSARTRVHEYGGGAWWLGSTSVYVANWSDQRLYTMAIDDDGMVGEPVALTPEPPAPAAWRFADGREHPDGDWVVCVRERHRGDEEAINELVAVPVGGGEPRIIGLGPTELADDIPMSDFVAAPRFSPDGRWLSWIRWNHPQMPWDGTELCVAPVFGGLRLGNIQVVAGNEGEAIHGADWTSAGRLVYSTDRSGFWNLHAWRPGSNGDEPLTTLRGAEIGSPPWVFGTQRWTELSDGQLAVVTTTAATDAIAVVDHDGALHPLDSAFVMVDALAATDRGTLVAQGSSPLELGAVCELDVDGSVVAVHRPPDDLGVDPAWFSTGTSVVYESGDRRAQAFVYLPTGPGLSGPADQLPPLVVMGHGGPTAHAAPALNLRIQYWTSRGFAVADVNYGGSSGFGRGYRRLLDDAWGVVDVEDCVAIAERLAADGVVDPARLAIRGGSAGGFTVLLALMRSDTFAAGTSLYGVADLEALARDTHKFESRYLDGLIGPYPQRIDRYRERSPISHVDELSCPLLVLQGMEDEIVPPNQSEAIVGALAAKGIPHAYVTFEGEQHGFRQAANIVRSYEVELWFYGRVFGFEPADAIAAPDGAVGL